MAFTNNREMLSLLSEGRQFRRDVTFKIFTVIIYLFLFSSFFKVFQGNYDRYTPVSHDLKNPIITRYIRIHPKTWETRISMRAEFYGCSEGKNAQFQLHIRFK